MANQHLPEVFHLLALNNKPGMQETVSGKLGVKYAIKIQMLQSKI